MLIGYAIRFIVTSDSYQEGEFLPKKIGLGTADLHNAKIYKDFKRACGWAYYPQENEIVAIWEDESNIWFVKEIVESRKANISRIGDDQYDHLGNKRI